MSTDGNRVQIKAAAESRRSQNWKHLGLRLNLLWKDINTNKIKSLNIVGNSSCLNLSGACDVILVQIPGLKYN